MSDTNWDYSGSCGRCMEVKCDPTTIGDNYGGRFDRSWACRDNEASVIVQITDTCPCNYPSNAYSNKRWCCGDEYHLDLSTWAFEKTCGRRRRDSWGVETVTYGGGRHGLLLSPRMRLPSSSNHCLLPCLTPSSVPLLAPPHPLQLAEDKWGVIGIMVRPVSCSTKPWKPAPTPPEGASPENTRIPRPWGWTDRRPWN
ncbi:hypothetical protein TSOC_006810 [Tetrabaena socialis]|uniref:Expansin-like EG45 domain-containing protein n=1 Tax=Tetrabaena socialis TaxID=47790 RepID=A0A2J8A2N8_9CHLO|nr:hypothetical protein TSOC_006810 [Tetrabaena socialis]|eukprot:PNH06786.1 hypothetical protein TSOC_006810 [Tetrabaena socialis]